MAETRQEILDVATELVIEQGCDEAVPTADLEGEAALAAPAGD